MVDGDALVSLKVTADGVGVRVVDGHPGLPATVDGAPVKTVATGRPVIKTTKPELAARIRALHPYTAVDIVTSDVVSRSLDHGFFR